LLWSGCDRPTQATNAAEFSEQVQRLDYEIKLLPARDGWPGLVEGIGTSRDGIKARFTYSFGPDPRRDVPKGAKVGFVEWFNEGDGFYAWTEDYPASPDLSKRQINRFYDMVLDIDDAACLVIVDRNCGVLPDFG
jgi:hypothetical protein